MDVLQTTYGYEFRDLIEFKVQSYNSYGWADSYSPINTSGETLRVEPTTMGTIYINAFETTIERVTVYWSELTTGEDIGDSLILSYNLQWDSGTNSAEWTNLIGNPVKSTLN